MATRTDLETLIDRYNEAWNAHDVDAIMAMHAPDMVFENHTAGERAEGEAVREPHRGDLRGLARPELRDPPPLRARRPHRAGVDGDRDAQPDDAPRRPRRRAERQAVRWDGMDIIPVRDGLIVRKDVYSDSVSILRQVGLLS